MKDRELAESILKVTREHPEYSYNYKQVAAVLGVKDAFIRKRIVTLLKQLAKNGVLTLTHKNKIKLGKTFKYSSNDNYNLTNIYYLNEDNINLEWQGYFTFFKSN